MVKKYKDISLSTFTILMLASVILSFYTGKIKVDLGSNFDYVINFLISVSPFIVCLLTTTIYSIIIDYLNKRKGD